MCTCIMCIIVLVGNLLCFICLMYMYTGIQFTLRTVTQCRQCSSVWCGVALWNSEVMLYSQYPSENSLSCFYVLSNNLKIFTRDECFTNYTRKLSNIDLLRGVACFVCK